MRSVDLILTNRWGTWDWELIKQTEERHQHGGETSNHKSRVSNSRYGATKSLLWNPSGQRVNIIVLLNKSWLANTETSCSWFSSMRVLCESALINYCLSVYSLQYNWAIAAIHILQCYSEDGCNDFCFLQVFKILTYNYFTCGNKISLIPSKYCLYWHLLQYTCFMYSLAFS